MTSSTWQVLESLGKKIAAEGSGEASGSASKKMTSRKKLVKLLPSQKSTVSPKAWVSKKTSRKRIAGK